MAQDVAIRGDEPIAAGSTARLVGGFLGRAWLWFLGGCLVITVAPLIFGWRPYVVQTGSMEPRIHVGDVVLAAPVHNVNKLVGRVTVFYDPGRHEIVTHRVIGKNPDGTLVTKGDANPTPDSAPLVPGNVRGMGRLLVRWLGLPVVWANHRDWLPLGGVAASLALAGFLVARHRDEDDVHADDAGAGEGGTGDGMDGGDGTDDGGDGTDGGPAGGGQSGGSDRSRQSAAPDYAPVTMSPGVSAEYAQVPADGGTGVVDMAVLAAEIPWPGHPLRRTDIGRPTGGRYVGRHRRPAHRRVVRSVAAPAGAARRVSPVRRFAARVAAVAVGLVALVAPTSQAAFSAATQVTTNTWTAGVYNYTSEVNALGPWLYWKLDDPITGRNPPAADSSGNGRPGVYSRPNSWTAQITGALPDQTPNLAALSAGVTPTNNPSCIFTAQNGDGLAAPGPAAYTLVVWFRTAPGYANGGKLLGLESSRTGLSNSNTGGKYDRMLYMDGAGHVWFGVWRTSIGQAVAISSPSSYNDGNWHMAAATMNATSGMTLYVDGQPVATNPNTESETETTTSYWRAGCGNLAGWAANWLGPNPPAAQTNYAFAGGLDEVAVWLRALTATDIADLYFYR